MADDVTSLRIVRVLPATPEQVFDAWTDPEAVRVWMCPGEIFESPATMDVRVGGAFTITMRSPGKDDVHTGVYREVDRPRRLAFTWVSQSTQQRPTLVTIDLRSVGAGCELTLVHEDLPPDAVDLHTVGWKAHVRMLIGHLGGVETGAQGGGARG